MRKLVVILLLIIFSTYSYAGSCGIGKIISVLEGGWNFNDYMVRIDYSEGNSAHPGTEFSPYQYIVYRSSLDKERLKGIKSMALSAYLSGKTVWTYSHTNNCGDASEMGMGKWGN